jgi:(R,R)-butanediol dehydrogenase/meso-butanediol dehydrogenase/diacetyl reductase
MRATVLSEHKPALRLQVLDDPSPGQGEVLLEVDACGICGSDLHLISRVAEPGTILGHEVAATIAELGPGVDGSRFATGTRVAVRPPTGCNRCDWCRRGRHDHCAGFALIGQDRPGGFAELLVAPSQSLYAMPGQISGADQALVEPLAVARRALRRGGLVAGENLLVLGGGPIGLAVTAWARTLGAGKILVSEPLAPRRELASRLGADLTVDPMTTDLAAIIAESLGEAPPLVIECSGVAGLIGQGLLHAGVDGRVVVVGICLAMDEIFPWFGIQKEVDLRFALYYGPEDWTDTLSAMADGRLAAAGMITQTIALDALPQRFAELVATPDGGKVVVLP